MNTAKKKMFGLDGKTGKLGRDSDVHGYGNRNLGEEKQERDGMSLKLEEEKRKLFLLAVGSDVVLLKPLRGRGGVGSWEGEYTVFYSQRTRVAALLIKQGAQFRLRIAIIGPHVLLTTSAVGLNWSHWHTSIHLLSRVFMVRAGWDEAYPGPTLL